MNMKYKNTKCIGKHFQEAKIQPVHPSKLNIYTDFLNGFIFHIMRGTEQCFHAFIRLFFIN